MNLEILVLFQNLNEMRMVITIGLYVTGQEKGLKKK